MSLRKAINAMCRQCTYDNRDVGTAAQQIACCIITSCPLHAYRPVTASFIPARLLKAYKVAYGELDDRARPLVRSEVSCAVDAQNGHLLSLQLILKEGPEGSLQ
jgi:hypothetical protein